MASPLKRIPNRLSIRSWKFVSRHRLPVLAIAAALLMIVSISAIFTFRLTEARNAAVKQNLRQAHLQQFTVGMFEGFDKEAGAANNLRVEDLLDLGAKQAQSLINEPAIQADLRQTLGSLYQKIGKFDKADEQLRMALATERSASRSTIQRSRKPLLLWHCYAATKTATLKLKISFAKPAQSSSRIRAGSRSRMRLKQLSLAFSSKAGEPVRQSKYSSKLQLTNPAKTLDLLSFRRP